MYTLANNVLGRLKYDITGAAVSLVVEPLAGTPFNLPPAPTSAAGLTYGEPWGIVTLIDRLDSSAAKIEHILYDTRAAELAGAYTLSGLVRGQEGSAAQAWVAGAYVMQQATDEVFGQKTPLAVMRGGFTLVHARDAVVTWDGTNFKFSKFRLLSIGRGRHFSTTGVYDIQMPVNGTVCVGFGGAANAVVAAGAIPLVVNTALWYEPNIGGGDVSIAGNFKVTGFTTDFVVPPHWIFLAGSHDVATAGEFLLRVANGATLLPWRLIGGAGEPAFGGTWVNFGGTWDTAAFMKGPDQIVRLKGLIKSGVINTAAFTLPAGYRPALDKLFAVESNGAYGRVQIANTGVVTPGVGSNVSVSLEGISFKAEL